MIKIGTKVTLAINQFDRNNSSPLINLLNTLTGEVIHSSVEADIPGRVYYVAFELEHMDAIQKARNEEAGSRYNCQLPIVGLNRFLERPKDPRFWYTVYSDEISQA